MMLVENGIDLSDHSFILRQQALVASRNPTKDQICSGRLHNAAHLVPVFLVEFVVQACQAVEDLAFFEVLLPSTASVGEQRMLHDYMPGKPPAPTPQSHGSSCTYLCPTCQFKRVHNCPQACR